MRLNIQMDISADQIPIDYRRKILSFIKSSLEEYSPQLYEALYLNGTIKKDFTFAAYFGHDATIESEVVRIPSRSMSLTISTPDLAMGLHIYNVFATRKGKERPLANCGAVRITKIIKIEEKCLSNSAVFKTLSPIVIRDHIQEVRSTRYYTYGDHEFLELMQRNTVSELQRGKYQHLSYEVEQLKFTPIAMRRTVAKSYAINFPVSLGMFQIEGAPPLLQYLYETGIGGRRSLGFGCIDTV